MPAGRSPGPVTLGHHDATLLRLAECGLPLSAIGAVVGCSGPTVCLRLKLLRRAAGIPGRKPMASYVHRCTGRPTRRVAGASA